MFALLHLQLDNALNVDFELFMCHSHVDMMEHAPVVYILSPSDQVLIVISHKVLHSCMLLMHVL